MIKIFKCFITFISVLFLTSCLGDDPTKISDIFIWEPTYSFPISQIEIGVEDFNDSITFLDYYTENEEVIIRDTINFSYSNVADDINKVQSLLFRFYILNEFPSNIEFYAYFYDSTGIQLGSGSLFKESPETIDIPSIDNEGYITDTNEVTFDIKILEDEIDTYQDLSQIELELHFKDLNTEENVLNHLEDYYVSISLGVRAELSVANL